MLTFKGCCVDFLWHYTAVGSYFSKERLSPCITSVILSVCEESLAMMSTAVTISLIKHRDPSLRSG